MTNDNAVPQKQTSRCRWWIHLVLIGGYFVAAIPLLLVKAPRRSSSIGSGGLLTTCAFEIAIFAVVFGLGWLASRASSEELLLKWRQGWWTVPLGIGYSIVMRIAIAVVLILIVATLLVTGVLDRDHVATFSRESRPAVERIVDRAAMENDRVYYWLTITVVSFVVAGLREELWRSGTLAGMRALWPDLFEDRDGQIAAVALIAIAFGLAHLSLGLVASAMAAILGFLLGIIMVLHHSIWPAVIAHGMFDATTFALLPIALQHFQR